MPVTPLRTGVLTLALLGLTACAAPDPGAPATGAGAPSFDFTAFSLPVNATLTNGDFEAGDLSVGWMTGGTENHSETWVAMGANHLARVEVGEGPIGDASCDTPGFSNFGYLDQLFALPKNHVVELDFQVPLPATVDATENATCIGFDRIEIDFVVEDTATFDAPLLGVITIDYIAATGQTVGHLHLFDDVTGNASSVAFDPNAFSPTSNGALVLEESSALPGWLHASFDLSTALFPWLPDDVVFRVTVRNEDNRYTGQHFAVSVDNVAATPSVLEVTIDIKPEAAGNPFTCANPNPPLPVAILTTPGFDATTVDHTTVRFGRTGTEAAELHGARHEEDVDGDGDVDLLFHFRTGDTGLTCADTQGILTGMTFGGTAISAADVVTPVGRGAH